MVAHVRSPVLAPGMTDSPPFYYGNVRLTPVEDASPARDEEFATNVNALMEDPERPLVWVSAPSSSSAPQASSSRQA